MFQQKRKTNVNKPMRQHMRNIGKARFAQSLNNYNALKETIDNQLQRRIDLNVAAKPKQRFEIA
jgi:hypothetical protein